MKTFTREALQKLDNITKDDYIKECIQDLLEINYSNPYPATPEKYYDFIRQTIELATQYNIANKRYTFSLVLAWHVYGPELRYHQKTREILESTEVSEYEKHNYLMQLAMNTIEATEARL
jgi:hypothetical protein